MLKRLFPLLCALALVCGLHAQNRIPEVEFQKTTKAPIRNVVFRNAPLLSPQDRDEIANAARKVQITCDASNENPSGLPDEAAERLRAAYQNRGYFKVHVEGRAVRVPADPLGRYDIIVRVVDPGQQYRLGDLNIIEAPRFPTQQLRDLFPIERGEIFSREKIAEGLDALRRLYYSQGYINYAGVPDSEFDDDNAIANLTINADEGKQFRLRNVDVLGLDTDTKARVLGELDMKPGDIYIPELWERSLLRFRDLVNVPDPNIVAEKLDEKNGWVNAVLDFRKPRICSRVTYSGPPILSSTGAP